jgi:hypothetical protein
MEVDARNYPTPPMSIMTRFGRRVLGTIERYWKDRISRRIRSASSPSSNLRSRPA